MITEIVPGIFSIDHQVAEGKNVVILSERGAWAVDTGSTPAEGREIADYIRGRGYTPNRLIYTHGHGDHVLGSSCFQGSDVFAHALTPVEIRRLLPALAARAGLQPEALAATIAWPTVTFRDELFLDLGNKQLHLFPTPGHSQDGVSIYVEEDRLLIAGDSVVTGIVPAIGDGNSLILEASLRRLARREIDVMVPGHGAVVYGRDAVQGWLQWLPDYLHSVRDFVQSALGRGESPAQIPALCDYDQFIGERLPKDRHNMAKRHRATVAKIVTENN